MNNQYTQRSQAGKGNEMPNHRMTRDENGEWPWNQISLTPIGRERKTKDPEHPCECRRVKPNPKRLRIAQGVRPWWKEKWRRSPVTSRATSSVQSFRCVSVRRRLAAGGEWRLGRLFRSGSGTRRRADLDWGGCSAVGLAKQRSRENGRGLTFASIQAQTCTMKSSCEPETITKIAKTIT